MDRTPSTVQRDFTLFYADKGHGGHTIHPILIGMLPPVVRSLQPSEIALRSCARNY